jgi:hypothetical protein
LSKFITTKTINSILLAILLVIGTIATILPSAQAGSYLMDTGYGSYEPEPREYHPPPQYTDRQYNNYPSEYEMDNIYEKKSYRNDNYEPREYASYQQEYGQPYEKDNNNYKYQKESKIVKKLNCINTNIVNFGDNTGDFNVGNNDRVAEEEGGGGGEEEGYDGYGGADGYYKKDKGFVCINNNNNTINNIVEGNATDGNQTEFLTCEECFREFLTEAEIAEFLIRIGSATLEIRCDIFEETMVSEVALANILVDVLGDADTRINDIIDCLILAGIVEFEEFNPVVQNGFNVQGGVPISPGATFNLP